MSDHVSQLITTWCVAIWHVGQPQPVSHCVRWVFYPAGVKNLTILTWIWMTINLSLVDSVNHIGLAES